MSCRTEAVGFSLLLVRAVGFSLRRALSDGFASYVGFDLIFLVRFSRYLSRSFSAGTQSRGWRWIWVWSMSSGLTVKAAG